MNSVIVWDLETVPDLRGFAAANDLGDKSDDEIREALGDKFPKHVYHSIACIGALIAYRKDGHWEVDALGAPHVWERSEKELITSFVDKIEELTPQLVTFNGNSFDLPVLRYRDVFPQDITRALLNLISNGFYAATKRKAEANGGDYEPTLTAATKNLGDRVEIRIRDNGMGIPQEVKEKIFNPFFTTKPAGEGTGLGLSISHDIIVKQHGGSIEVDTQPGEFTELRIILPRAAVFQPSAP